MGSCISQKQQSSEINEVVLPNIESFMEYHIKGNDPWKGTLIMSKA